MQARPVAAPCRVCSLLAKPLRHWGLCCMVLLQAGTFLGACCTWQGLGAAGCCSKRLFILKERLLLVCMQAARAAEKGEIKARLAAQKREWEKEPKVKVCRYLHSLMPCRFPSLPLSAVLYWAWCLEHGWSVLHAD